MRDEIEMSREHLARSLARGHTSPRHWTFAIRMQLARIDATRLELSELGPARQRYDALGIDVHFMLIGVRHVLRYQAKYVELVNDDRLRRGLENFEATAIDSAYLRNMLEHLDEYVIGKGEHQRKISAAPRELQPMFVEASGQPDADFDFVLGNLSIPIRATADAAIELGELLETVWNDRFGYLKSRPR